jgi:hypothetical protein
MIVLEGYETILREDKAELLFDDRKQQKSGSLYLTNERLIFESEDGRIERTIPLDRVRPVQLTDDYSFRVSYAKEDNNKIFTDEYRVASKGKSKDWVNDLQKNLQS